MPRPSKPAQRAQPLAESRDPLPGMVVNGKYRVLGVLAKGGMGKIYRAEQVPLGRAVALKVLRTRYADDEDEDPQFQKRFFLEASILSKLQHVNIVTLYDYGQIENVAPDQYFMAMEFLRGDTLAKRLKKIVALHPRDAVRTFRQIARGLREAHKLGIVHRDLKPSNIMLVPDEDGAEVVKILDFGIGKILGDGEAQEQELTAEGAFLGSPRYMAPEQINEGRVDPRTDVYSLGVMLYESLCGKIPFEGDTNINTMMAHCNLPVPAMRDRNPDVIVPEPLESLARHCLEKDPGARPQTMEAFLRELTAREEQLYGPSALTSSGPFTTGRSSVPPAPISHPDGGTLTGSWDRRRTSVPTLDAPPSSRASSPPTGTHRSLTRSQFPIDLPPPQPRRRSVLPFLAGGGVALAITVAVVVAIGLGKRAAPPAAAAPQATASGPAAPQATSALPAPSAPTSYTLIIDSTPPLAQVYEGDALLGTTPLQLPVDRKSVAAAPRRFVVKLDGYAPYTLLQGDSEINVRVVAPLVSEPSSAPEADVKTASNRPPHVGWTAPANPPATAQTSRPPPPPPPPDDIKTRR